MRVVVVRREAKGEGFKFQERGGMRGEGRDEGGGLRCTLPHRVGEIPSHPIPMIPETLVPGGGEHPNALTLDDCRPRNSVNRQHVRAICRWHARRRLLARRAGDKGWWRRRGNWTGVAWTNGIPRFFTLDERTSVHSQFSSRDPSSQAWLGSVR